MVEDGVEYFSMVGGVKSQFLNVNHPITYKAAVLDQFDPSQIS